jgi:DNA repair protein RadD
MSVQLHPHQIDLVGRVRDAFRCHRSVLMQGATGIGKTTIAAEIIRMTDARGNAVLFCAHLDSLVSDTSDRLTAAGIAHGIIQADRPTNHSAPVQVCSLATLHARPDCRPDARLIIVDECRRAAAPTVRAILAAYPKAKLLGLDATPERGDGSPLSDLFEHMVCGPSIAWLTQRGFLAQCVVLSPPQPGDGALAADPVDAYREHAGDRRAIVFCKDIAHARDVTTRFGSSAALVTGDTTRADRDRVRAAVAAGELRIVVNVDVYRDGADLPALECVVLARAFGVASGYLQAVGRGMRASAATGKRDCLVLDLSGAAIVHGLPADDRVWSLDGPPRRTAAALSPLARCRKCLAVFHAGPVMCPRCGVSTQGTRLPRRATRIEKQELARLDTRPQAERDLMTLRGIEKRLRSSGRFPECRISTIARSIFERTKKRSAPEAA